MIAGHATLGEGKCDGWQAEKRANLATTQAKQFCPASMAVYLPNQLTVANPQAMTSLFWRSLARGGLTAVPVFFEPASPCNANLLVIRLRRIKRELGVPQQDNA